MSKRAKKNKKKVRRDPVPYLSDPILDRVAARATAIVLRDDPPESIIPTVAADAGEPVILALVPPDLERCQCEWPDQSNQTFGPKPTTRCSRAPTVVAFQKRIEGEVEPTGAMSLCDDHRILVDHMFSGQVYYRTITHNRQIGDLV